MTENKNTATKLDDIPADETQTMTADLIRLFKAAGCDPACHSCERKIKRRRKFKLASIHGRDEMLCGRCTPASYQRRKDAESDKRYRERERLRNLHAHENYWERKRQEEAARRREVGMTTIRTVHRMGYSRPSRGVWP